MDMERMEIHLKFVSFSAVCEVVIASSALYAFLLQLQKDGILLVRLEVVKAREYPKIQASVGLGLMCIQEVVFSFSFFEFITRILTFVYGY